MQNPHLLECSADKISTLQTKISSHKCFSNYNYTFKDIVISINIGKN